MGLGRVREFRSHEGGTANAGDRVQVIQVLLAGQGGDDARDPRVQYCHELGQVVDLVEVVPAHPGVMLADVSVQSRDECSDLAPGGAGGQFGEYLRVTFAADQRLEDAPGTDPDHVRQDAGQFHAGVFEWVCRDAVRRLSAPVGVTSVLNADDDDLSRALIDLVDDPEVASSRAVQALKLQPERLAHPIWILGERAVAELDDGASDLFWQLGLRALGSRAPCNVEGHD